MRKPVRVVHWAAPLLLTLGICLAGPLSAAELPEWATSSASLREQALRWTAPVPDYDPRAAGQNAALVHLGRSLFKERLLSQQVNVTCASCHRLSQGIGSVNRAALDRGTGGEVLKRNTPVLLNTSLHRLWNWDGGATALNEQLRGHIFDPGIMGMTDEASVVKRLDSNPSYEVAFNVAYKELIATDPEQAPALSFAHTLEALSAYLATLASHDRFDAFLQGDDQALLANEQRGLAHFIQLGCVACHQGPALGGEQTARLGVKSAAGEDLLAGDEGRFALTGAEEDQAVFKVPSLRNVALSGPYFHAGQIERLDQAVTLMAQLQLGQTLEPEVQRDILAFLNSLTDQQQL